MQDSRSSLARRLGSTLLVLVLASACAHGTPPGEALPISADAKARAGRLLEHAEGIEIDLTALLVERLSGLDVIFEGLGHRTKTRESLERKIQVLMQAKQQRADQVMIDDALRYRVMILDEPAGRYDEVAHEALSRLERAGLEVVVVKNYWPPGDSYSGLNCALRTSDGFIFELQLHTVGSLAATIEGHALYEIFRDPRTPLRTRRQIFDRLVERWQWVQIPEGVLVPHSVHEAERILERPRP